MKKSILLIFFAIITAISTSAHDFAVANSDGVTIYYNKLSDTKVEVTCRGYSNNVFEDRYSGVIVLPADITFDGVNYSVYSIGDNAFAYCSDLTSVTIPNSVTSISSQAFYNCTSLVSVNIPNSITSINPYAFNSCTSLTSIDIPESVRYIGTYAFCGCSGLSSVIIGKSVTSIGAYAFKGCSQLKEFIIPISVTSIGEGAFQECSSLKAFYSTFASEDNRCLIVDDVLIAFAPSGITAYDIPASVTSIGKQAFAYCSNLTAVYIPESVSTFDRNAFAYCSSLASVTLPKAVIEVGQGSFAYCTGLTSIYAKPTTPPMCGGSAFFNVDKNACIVYTPNESVENYKTADQWKEFKYITGLVESISLNKSTLDLNIGTSEQLTVDIDKTVTWTSSNDEVATVDANGMVTAVGVGTATITATCGDVSATCTVTVNPIVAAAVTLDKAELELLIGESETLVATVSPDNTTDKTITWTSSNAEVATVDANGMVTAVSLGTATITATCGSVSATCEVSVKSYSGIENVSGESFGIRVEGSELVIEGLADDALVYVFTVDSKLVYTGCERRIALQSGEVYIVAYPGGARKIAL